MKNLIKILSILFLILTCQVKVAYANNEDVIYLAATLFGEAKGADTSKKQILANTIINRYNRSNISGNKTSIKDTVVDYWLYTSWNDKKNWSTEQLVDFYQKQDSETWSACMEMAQKAVTGSLPDLIGGKTDYLPVWKPASGTLPEGLTTETNVTTNTTNYGSSDVSPTNSNLGTGSAAPQGTNTPLPADKDYSADACANAVEGIEGKFYTEITDAPLLDKNLLKKMHDMMVTIYKALSIVFMLGHSLVCYATTIDYTCIGLRIANIEACALKIPHFGFLIAGMIIYMVAFFMTMSIGMYFVDISFKLGFAILFFPITMALWPFPPTKGKFGENLSIIIRNAMLFTFISIGVSYAVTLIHEGILGTIDQNQYWDAILQAQESWTDQTRKESTELLSQSFSLDSDRMLVILFCLIFGFKILESSVNNYLDTFFSDGVFGSSSPMHHMGTQAVGWVSSRTVAPALSFAKDVATATTGRAIAGVGRGISRMASGDFSDVKKAQQGLKNIAHKAANPRETYNQAMQSAGEKINRGINKVGEGTKKAILGAQDTLQVLKPGTYYEDRRQANKEDFENRMNKPGGVFSKIDNFTQKLGAGAEEVVAHGGGHLKAGAKIAGNKIGTSTVNASRKLQSSITGKQTQQMTEQEFIQKVDNVKSTVKGAVQGAKVAAQQGIETLTEKTKDGISSAGATIINNVNNMSTSSSQNVGAAPGVTKEQVREKLHNTKEGIKATPQKLKETAQALNDEANKAPISLAPSAILKSANSLIFHPQQTYRSVKKLAKGGLEELKQAKEDGEFKKVILKRTGQVVLRTTRDTAKDVGKSALGITGKFFENLGNNLADNRKRGGSIKDQIRAKEQAQKEAEEAQEEERINNMTFD